jgi:NADPH2:quinone reductase
LKALGADFVFDPADRSLGKAVKGVISPRRVDLAIDSVGGALLAPVIALLDYGGRVSVVGRSGGTVPEFNTGSLLFRRLRIGGVSVEDYSAQAAHAAWKEIVNRLDAMGQRPQVDTIVPFDEVKKGFARLAQGPMGKVLVHVAG